MHEYYNTLMFHKYVISYHVCIVNYAVVGVAIIYAVHISSNEVDSEAERASKLAEGSYACLYLIGALSKIVSSVEIMVYIPYRFKYLSIFIL